MTPIRLSISSETSAFPWILPCIVCLYLEHPASMTSGRTKVVWSSGRVVVGRAADCGKARASYST